jgi:hypothetical protein
MGQMMMCVHTICQERQMMMCTSCMSIYYLCIFIEIIYNEKIKAYTLYVKRIMGI